MSDGVHFLQDLQASPPEVRIGLSRAGVSGVRKAIRIRYGESEKLISADIDCTVDLDPKQKGVHMSRFPELFEEAIEEVVIEEALLVEQLAAHIAAQIVERQSALRAEVKIVAQYPLDRRTPVTDLPTQELVSLIVLAAASERATRRVVGVEATGINACPCAQGLVRARLRARLPVAGFVSERIGAIRSLLTLAIRNQPAAGLLDVRTAHPVCAELEYVQALTRHTELREWLAGEPDSDLNLVPVDGIVDDGPIEVGEKRVDVGAAVGLKVDEVRVLVDVERDERSRVPDRVRVLGVADVVQEAAFVPVVGGPGPAAAGHAARLQVAGPGLDRAGVTLDQPAGQAVRSATAAPEMLEVDLVVLDPPDRKRELDLQSAKAGIDLVRGAVVNGA